MRARYEAARWLMPLQPFMPVTHNNIALSAAQLYILVQTLVLMLPILTTRGSALRVRSTYPAGRVGCTDPTRPSG